jgi:hypothetical protein
MGLPALSTTWSGDHTGAAVAAPGAVSGGEEAKNCELSSPDDQVWQPLRVAQEKRARPFRVTKK